MPYTTEQQLARERRFKKASIDGTPIYVRFTMAELRKWTVLERNAAGQVLRVGPKPRASNPSATVYKKTLAELLGWLDGQHNDPEILDRARSLLST